MLTFRDFVEFIGIAIDCTGVMAIAFGLLYAIYSFVATRSNKIERVRQLRQNLGIGILVGLEILIAADIIRTVAMTPTLQSVIVLGFIVLIRTFLSMTLQVELDGRWPWKRSNPDRSQA